MAFIMSTSTVDPSNLAPPFLPDRLPMVRHLDPAAALAYRTPLMEHFLSADGKAAGVLTLMGMMFTVLARLGGAVDQLLRSGAALRYVVFGLLLAFASLALSVVVLCFRTIAPRFPKAPPSLAFFGDIASLSRDEYIQRVRSLSPREALEQILNYNHTTATICTIKAGHLAKALQLFKAVAGGWLILIIILAWRMFQP